MVQVSSELKIWLRCKSQASQHKWSGEDCQNLDFVKLIGAQKREREKEKNKGVDVRETEVKITLDHHDSPDTS